MKTGERILRILDGSQNGEVHDDDSVWTPTSISEAAANPPPKPDKLNGTIYSDAQTLVSGEPGVGKSMYLTVAAAGEAIDGGTPLYLDFEATAGVLLDRLEAAGLSDAQLHQVLYLRPKTQASPEEIAEMVDRCRPTMVLVDSYDAALSAFALDGMKNEDIRIFNLAVMVPLRSAGATLIVADHVSKNREQRGNYSIGGQAKLALADAHLGLSVIAPLQRGGLGKLKVKTLKDRHGWLARSAIFELNSHVDTGALSWTIKGEVDHGDEDGFKPTVLMEKVSRYLEHQSTPSSQRQVEGDVPGKGAYLRTAISLLAQEGYIERADGPRGAFLLTSCKPYRQDGE